MSASAQHQRVGCVTINVPADLSQRPFGLPEGSERVDWPGLAREARCGEFIGGSCRPSDHLRSARSTIPAFPLCSRPERAICYQGCITSTHPLGYIMGALDRGVGPRAEQEHQYRQAPTDSRSWTHDRQG